MYQPHEPGTMKLRFCFGFDVLLDRIQRVIVVTEIMSFFADVSPEQRTALENLATTQHSFTVKVDVKLGAEILAQYDTDNNNFHDKPLRYYIDTLP